MEKVIELKKVDEIINRYQGDRSFLINIFLDIQQEFRYLPRKAIERVVEALGISLSQAYAVATFYKIFSLVPKGEHEIFVCLGTSCHLRGGPHLVESFERNLNIKVGETTADMKFSLRTVNCLGACALSPLVRIDQKNYAKMTADAIPKIIQEYRQNPNEKGKDDDEN